MLLLMKPTVKCAKRLNQFCPRLVCWERYLYDEPYQVRILESLNEELNKEPLKSWKKETNKNKKIKKQKNRVSARMIWLNLLLIFFGFLLSVVQCPVLLPPTNGTVETSRQVYRDIYKLSCNAGYLPKVSTKRECLPNGTWSEQIPTCAGTVSNNS